MTDSPRPRDPGSGQRETPLPQAVPAPVQRRIALPVRQPARALVAAAGYVVVVALAGALLSLRASGPLAALLLVMWALLMLVPLVVLAPTPVARPAQEADAVPVLQRAQARGPRGRADVAPPQRLDP